MTNDHIIQLTSACIWFSVVLCLLPSLLRTVRGIASESDEWRSVVFVAGLLFIGFPVRRMILPTHAPTWEALYTIAIVLGISVLAMLYKKKQ